MNASCWDSPAIRKVNDCANDFLVHIAATSTENLRDFVVVNLSGNPDVALTETNLIFEHVRASITH